MKKSGFVWLVLLVVAACSESSTPPPPVDSGGGVDSGTVDSGGGTDSSVPIDATPPSCDPAADTCAGGTECRCCPSGPITDTCFCTTACTDDDMCTDAVRSDCNQPDPGLGGAMGICAPVGFRCAWGAMCTAPDTAIATPDGDRAIAELREGDLVYSVDGAQIVAVPIARVSRTPVQGHSVMRVTLEAGAVLNISAGHPTADGRTFGEIAAGEDLGGLSIESVERVPYPHAFTYDILPASDTGDYFAGGAQIGSTLTP